MFAQLTKRDIFALGFMTFALFVGAGNIIFPPQVGFEAGSHVWLAAIGFLITAVGLPVLTMVSLARVGGGIGALSAPIGRWGGLVVATICYLVVGPLFATPRTAAISYELGFAPLLAAANQHYALFFYSLIYFSLVVVFSLYPGKLLDTVGRFLAPLKIISLAVLVVTAIFKPAGISSPATESYQHAALANGVVNGYLTLDTLGAMVFGIVVVNAIRARGIQDKRLLTRYTMIAAFMAGIGLTLIYLGLFRLGASSGGLVQQGSNGAVILQAYVFHTFGNTGRLFLATLIFIACMVTAIGLTCACAEFFSTYLPYSYRSIVCSLGLCAMLFANLGLDELIKFSLPILNAIYPPCIVLIVSGFTWRWWRNSSIVIVPTMLTSLLFSIIDELKKTPIAHYLPEIFNQLPLVNLGLSWLLPTCIVMLFAAILDRVLCSKPVSKKSAL